MVKKSETFIKEHELLHRVKAFGNGEAQNPESYQAAFSELILGYEELLQETKFLTKVSDRLEKKLSKANDQLEQHNKHIQAENTGLSRENKRVKEKANQIIQEHDKLGKKLSKFQVAVMVIIFLVFMIVLGGFYILFGDGSSGTGLMNS